MAGFRRGSVSRYRPGACFLLIGVLGGCGSIAKGITEAILEKSEEKDTRACHIQGPVSKGLEASLEKQERDRAGGNGDRVMRVLMVHGIGKHLPGYSGRFTEHLMRELKLDVREERFKEIKIRDPRFPGRPLGTLRISRHLNKARSRELIFYELTWSEITDPEKELIAFDDSTEYAFRRTGLNNTIKGFVNSHIPDPLIYLGESRVPILTAVRQSLCWMTSGDWADYPTEASRPCELFSRARLQHLDDDVVFVTHSLGSRIIIDALQLATEEVADKQEPVIIAMKERFQRLQAPVYMLANQLPLLQLGRKPAAVHGQIDAYCRPSGEKYADRLVSRISIHAFSDPNDALSYAIPPKFANNVLESRLCPKITNIILNVAKPISIFGLGEVANPAEAHGGYDHDDRVVAIIARGFGHPEMSPLVKDRCTWIETIDES
jgi:hypothetical protein